MENIPTILFSALAFGVAIYAVLGQRIDNLEPMRARVLRIAPEDNDLARDAARSEERARRRVSTDQRTSIERAIDQAGLSWTPSKYKRIRAIAAGAIGISSFLLTQNYLIALVATVVSVAAIPGVYVAYVRSRRYKKFLHDFPTAIDVMVRSVTAGLPVSTALTTIVQDLKPPVSQEFQRVIDRISLGESVALATTVLQDRVPLPEVHFFVATIGVQQRTGGSLSGTLDNLSAVIRDRKDMTEKITALSSEARMSALILAALPPLVMVGFAVMNPSYLAPLVTTTMGHLTLGGAAIWMAFGGLIMRKMINLKV